MRPKLATLNCSVTIIIALMVCSNLARADNLYVNNVSGNDLNDGSLPGTGKSNSGPFLTIARALRRVQPGDHVLIQKTSLPYHESLTVQGARHSGSDISPFTIISNGAILDGTAPVPEAAWEHFRDNVFRFRPGLMSHQQVYVDGRPADRVTNTEGNVLPDLEPTQWALNGGWVYFCTAPGRIPSQYVVRYAKFQTGITLYDVRNVVVQGLVVQGFQLDGINAHDSVSNATISECKLRGNGRSGLSVGGASRVKINTTLVGDNFAAQIRSEGYCDLDIDECRILKSPKYGPPILREGGRVALDGTDYR